MMTPHSNAPLCAGLGFMGLLTAADASQLMDSVDETPPETMPVTQPPPADAASGGERTPFPSVRGIIPGNIFDPDSVAWSSRRDMSSSAFSSWFNAMKSSYMLIDIEVDEVSGSQQVAGVWQDNLDNRDWAEYRNMTSSQFSTKWDEMEQAGYRLIDQEAYQLNGSWYYAGIWVENSENLAWASYRNLTSSDFSDYFTLYQNAGYIMVDVEAYSTASGLRYAMIWVHNTENLGWAEYRNMSSSEFADKFNQLQSTHRVWDVESYTHNGTIYYAGIWVENDNNRGWAEYRNMTETGWRNRWYRLRDQGYRLVDFEKYPYGSGWRYAGVWRQNNDRPDWPLKGDMDTDSENFRVINNVTGLGVAIARNGEIKYLRGFGEQDADNGIWYHGYTLNRLASVAKAVSGVLTLRMLQEGQFTDLDDFTWNYIDNLPLHHTHSLRQLLGNRSGVGHYDDYNVPTNSYATALAAAQQFWNVDSDPNTPGTQLVYTPGTACKYSTHGHTIVGAALEGIAGQPIGDIVIDEISDPFALTTLQLEDRGDGNINRTLLYNSGGSKLSADDISWKVLGGGLEASAYDMVRFGMDVIDGTILNQASLDELWTVPAPQNCVDPLHSNHSNYALGWRVGTQNNTPSRWKGGNQRGANTCLRVYPDADMVVVVQGNRSSTTANPYSTCTLGFNLAEKVLDATACERNDCDQDGLADTWENLYGTIQDFWLNGDFDGDGLNERREHENGTDPTNPDSDGDNLNDGFEVLTLGSDPLDTDTDGDGLPDDWDHQPITPQANGCRGPDVTLGPRSVFGAETDYVCEVSGSITVAGAQCLDGAAVILKAPLVRVEEGVMENGCRMAIRNP